jgi:hypothetical protein
MKPLDLIWQPLLQRRLLPVAILLIAALVAVPFLLKKDAEPVAPPAPVPAADSGSQADDATAQPLVSLVADGERSKRRRVLGARKNPFEPAPAAKAEATPQPQAAATEETTGGAPAGDEGQGGSDTTTTGGATTPGTTTPPASTPPASTPPAAAKPEYELYSLSVRFGTTEGDLPKLNLPRLKALPSAETPVLVYLGLAKDNKTAVFMVDSNVEPQGDGTCKPSPANCETIHLRVGDTEFFDVKDEAGAIVAQYELDLLNIRRKTTSSAAAAKAARAKVSKAGRRVLRVRQATRGPLRWSYDAKSGTVRKLDRKAYEARVAKTARVALAFAGGF